MKSPLGKYLLLQLPGWGACALVLPWLWSRGMLSGPIALGIGIFWVVKDLVLYPLLRSAYEPPGPIGAEALVGETAVVQRRLEPAGMVRLRAEIWSAEALGDIPVEVGSEVRVERAEGLRLFVRPTL